MHSAPPRKIPRIMSRVKPKIEPVQSSSTPSTSKAVEPRVSADHDALSRELSQEKVVVRDGVVVAVQHSKQNGVVSGILGASANSGGRRVVIDTGLSSFSGTGDAYTENPLPGIADEVESYPCKFCSEQVFLTCHGLERHGKLEHPDKTLEISEHIRRIQEEWARRERERTRHRERAQVMRMRQEGIAHAAVRNASRLMQPGSAGQGDLPSAEHPQLPQQRGSERFEACRICSLLINARHPTAMENHLRAHKKNDELRAQLLAEYGAEIVGRLTCHECHLVFTDESKLMLHVDHTHVRKRKYVCKWCGHVCGSMSDLNIHKADVHAMPAVQSRADRLISMRNKLGGRPSLSSHGHVANSGPFAAQDSLRANRTQDETICRTSCEECGLRLVRPSLLIRHMLRVHSKEIFSCEVETNGVPSFKIEVERGRIVWSCCDLKYVDRHEFLFHRRSEHLEKLSFQKMDTKATTQHSNTERILDMATANIPMQPSTSAYTGELVHGNDGSMQVVLPDGVDSSGEIYVVMMDENDEAKDMHLQYEEAADHVNMTQHEQQMEIQVPIGENGSMALSEETYQQLRAQFGDDLNNMQIVFMSEEEMNNVDGEVISQDNVTRPRPLSGDLTNEEIFAP